MRRGRVMESSVRVEKKRREERRKLHQLSKSDAQNDATQCGKWTGTAAKRGFIKLCLPAFPVLKGPLAYIAVWKEHRVKGLLWASPP